MTKYTRTKWYVHRILESTPWTITLQFIDHSHLAQFITSWVAEVSRTESKGWRGGPEWHFPLVLLLSLWLLFPSPPQCGVLCGCRSSNSRALCPLHASCSSSSSTNPLLVYGGKQVKLEERSSCWVLNISIGRHISQGGTQPSEFSPATHKLCNSRKLLGFFVSHFPHLLIGMVIHLVRALSWGLLRTAPGAYNMFSTHLIPKLLLQSQT